MTTKKRTPEQIADQIAGLKKDKETLPQYSFFGDDNWGAIDAQLDVLEGKAIASDFEDNDDDEEGGGENAICEAAQRAEDWLDGYIDDNLFDD